MLGAILHDELLSDVTELVKAYKVLRNKQFFVLLVLHGVREGSF